MRPDGQCPSLHQVTGSLSHAQPASVDPKRPVLLAVEIHANLTGILPRNWPEVATPEASVAATLGIVRRVLPREAAEGAAPAGNGVRTLRLKD